MAEVKYDQPLQYRRVGVGQATIPSSRNIAIPVEGNADHHLSMGASVPYRDPSPMRKGYPHPNMVPHGQNWLVTVRNSTQPSEVRKTFGRSANSRWSAQAIRKWLVGQKLAKTQNQLSNKGQG